MNLLLINENIHCSSFFECILCSGYLPWITLPTRLSDNSTLIDNILYNKQINLIFAGILENQISDPQAIVINSTHRPPPCKSKYITLYNNNYGSNEKFRTYINSLNLKNGSPNSFNHHFSTICTRDEPINSYYPSYNTYLNNPLNKISSLP